MAVVRMQAGTGDVLVNGLDASRSLVFRHLSAAERRLDAGGCSPLVALRCAMGLDLADPIRRRDWPGSALDSHLSETAASTAAAEQSLDWPSPTRSQHLC